MTGRLRAIAQAATPGPWWEDGEYVKANDPDTVLLFSRAPEDGAYIATFDPTLVSAMLDVIQEAAYVLEAHDDADDEMDWTGPTVDMRLRTALDRFREVAS